MNTKEQSIIKAVDITITILLAIIGLFLAYLVVSDYKTRMTEYNTHICKVEGFQPDCKTPLNTSDYLK